MEAPGYATWKRWDTAGIAEPTAIEKAYFDAEFSISLWLLAGFGRGTRLLELGYGSGSLLRWAESKGLECYGIESNPVLVDASKDSGLRTFRSLDEASTALGPAAVHLVTAFDVLEHIPQDLLSKYFLGIEQLLVPGGIFIARFPNGDSPFGLALQNGDLTHVTAIGSRKISHLASMSRLQVLEIRNPAQPNLGLAFADRIRRCVANGLRFLIERAIGGLYYGGRHVPLAPNLIAVLQKPASSAS